MTEGTGFRVKWLLTGKAIEFILGGPWDSGGKDAYYQLYNAVIEGEFRARFNGEEFTDFKRLQETTWCEDNSWALPPDIEVNLDVIFRIWNWDVYDLAELIATRRIGNATAVLRMEGAILNLRVLLKRVLARLPAMKLKQAVNEINYQELREKYTRDFNLLYPYVYLDNSRLEKLRDEFIDILD
mgnify:CR=1 FL=1